MLRKPLNSSAAGDFSRGHPPGNLRFGSNLPGGCGQIGLLQEALPETIHTSGKT
jgi:hypothetical protein